MMNNSIDITERPNPLSRHVDSMKVEDIVELIASEEIKAIGQVSKAKSAIGRLVKDVMKAIKAKGRVFYVGAGTSGRLGVMDAAEVPPTFGVPQNLFNAIMAGGKKAFTKAVEGAEDDVREGRRAMARITSKDIAIGISASGRTPFVLSCLKEAKDKGARTWLITFNPIKRHPFLDGLIKVIVGPEVIAGSTRLKAGTATKVMLNIISTASMIGIGKVYRNYMVDVKPTNRKLQERAKRIITELTGASLDEAEVLLNTARGRVKVAVLMKKRGLNPKEAERLLMGNEGIL